MKKKLKRKILNLRARYGIPNTDQEIFNTLVDGQILGVTCYMVAPMVGRHYGDWSYFNKLADNYDGVVVRVEGKGYIRYIREDYHRSYGIFSEMMKDFIKEAAAIGDLSTAEADLRRKNKYVSKI